MDPNKDYYAILGVHPTAEKAVIDAAYKALAKRYHPDMSQNNPDEAKRRMQEINVAYDVLSDAAKRKEYDKLRGDGIQQGEDYFRGEEESEPTYDPLEEDWIVAIEYHPELKIIDKNLKIISWKLSYAFRSYLIGNKNFKDAHEIASEMEQSFLERYFGDNPKIIELAKILIHNKKKDLSKELNRAVNVLGISKQTDVDDLEAFLKKFKEKTGYLGEHSDKGICKNCGKKTRNILTEFCDAQCVFEFSWKKK